MKFFKAWFVIRKLIGAEIGSGNSFAIGIDNWKAEKLSQLESIIEIEIHPCSACVSQPNLTAATSDLGIWLNLKNGLYL